MAFDVTIILPNNLRSGYLQSEFVASGLAYTTNKFSYDPSLDNNKNQISLGFQLRNKTTRDLTDLARIKTLYLSNDPYFEPTSTITISNWPPKPELFNSTVDYTYDINSNYFFDNSLSQGSFGSTSSGSGLFKINNWALSANGGLSRVYLKAVIEAPNGQLVEYPNGYGIFDTIIWEGTIPTNPDKLEYSSLKSGYTGKSSIFNFKSSTSKAQTNDDGISGYLLSSYEITSTGNTYDLYTHVGNTIYRTLCPSSSVAATTSQAYTFTASAGVNTYVSRSYTIGTGLALSSYGLNTGLMLYSNTKLLPTTNKPDIMIQGQLEYQTGSIGDTSSAYIKMYNFPEYQASNKELAIRVDIAENNNPVSYLYTITNGTASTNQQVTTLPNSLLPLLQGGGLYEMYYSQLDSSYAYVEGYFTPTLDQNQSSRKSYLLANSIVSSFGTTYLGAAIGYFRTASLNSPGTINMKELCIAQGKNILSADIGDCLNDNLTSANPPVTSITSGWPDSQNTDYIFLNDLNANLALEYSANASYFEIQKIDINNETLNSNVSEIQLYKPSMSTRCSLEVKVRHRTDDFYVAFSQKSSYRPHTENNLQVEWDNPMGSRCIDGYVYSENPVNAPTISVVFSKLKNQIIILQRNEDNTISKTLLKTYNPSDTYDRYLIEITDKVPNYLDSKTVNSTWIFIKAINGSNLDVLGYARLNNKMPSNASGLGYYSACGFISSTYDNSGGTTYNRIYEMIYRGLPSLNNLETENYASIRTVSLAPEALSNNKFYIGQKLLAGLTDFQDFSYSNPESSAIGVTVVVASNGSNVNTATIASATIDGVSLATLPLNSYILLKDQTTLNQNGLYLKSGTSTYTLDTSSYNVPYNVTDGNVNGGATFYKVKTQKDNEVADLFLSTSYFAPINIGQISTFISSLRAQLFEFKLDFTNYEVPIDHTKIKTRFYSDVSDSPDFDNPLTDWLNIATTPMIDTYTVAPRHNLVQVIMSNSANSAPTVSSLDKIWVQIVLPFNTALAAAFGAATTNTYVTKGKFTYYKLANNLWHKMFARYTSKSFNATHKNIQHARLRAKSHAQLESNATNIAGPAIVDINGPQYNGGVPKIDNLTNDNLRSIELSILAEDNESGILAFRIGRYIDNFRSQYTPWMSWDQFTVENGGKYFIYLYGNLNYYTSGIANSTFDYQNMGFSGPRKIWIQLMDYSGNITQSYPITFVAQSWALIDTQPPIGSASFYNPKTYSNVNLTNLISSVVKIEANDTVSGVKDYKTRRIYDSGADDWSDWQHISTYSNVSFDGEKDGVKKVEFLFRDFGNNAMQPETIWEIVKRPSK